MPGTVKIGYTPPVENVTSIIVDPNVEEDREGEVYSSIVSANSYCQSNPSEAPFVINIAAGQYDLEESIIVNTVPVLFVGQGKCKTIINFDRTNEDASHYFIRRTTAGTPEINTRFCFAFCDYTDQGSFGSADTASWEGRWGLKNMTVEMQYRGDNSTPLYMSAVYHDNYEGQGFDFIFENVRFQNIGAPTMAESDTATNHWAIRIDSQNQTSGDEYKPFDPIFKNVDIYGDKTLTGTVDVTTGNTALSGTGTSFTTELNEEGYIQVGEETYEIASITDDTTATLGRTADSTESGVRAVAVNPFNKGVSCDIDAPSIKPSITYKNCNFRWTFMQSIYNFSGEVIYIDSCLFYGCGVNMKGGTLDPSDSVIYVNASHAHMENLVFKMEHSPDEVWTDGDSHGIGIGEYVSECTVENIHFGSNSNMWNYENCIYTEARIKAKNISADNYIYNTTMIELKDTSDCDSSVLSELYSARTSAGAIDIPTNVTGVIVENSYFERGITLGGDETKLLGCNIEQGEVEVSGARCVIDGNTLWGDLYLNAGIDESMIANNYIDGSVHGTSGEEVSITNNRVMNKGAEGKFVLGKQSCMSNNYWEFHDDAYLTGAHYCEITGNTFYVRSSATALRIFGFNGDMVTFTGNTVQISASADSKIIYIEGGSVVANNVFEEFSFTKRVVHVGSSGNVRVIGNRFKGVTTAEIVAVEGDHSQVANNSFECDGSLCIDALSTSRFGNVSGNVMEVATGPADVVDITGDNYVVKGNVINNADGGSVTDYFDVSGDYNILANNIVRSRGNGTMINDTGTGNVTDNNLEDTRA